MGRLARLAALAGVIILAAAVGDAKALDRVEADVKVREATIVIEKFMKAEDVGTPAALLKRSKAVIIVPDLFKAGFLVGGKFGRGVMVARKSDGTWGAPSFVTLAGGSFGLQIGGEMIDLFLCMVKDRALRAVLRNQIKLGADVSIAAGPVGRQAAAELAAADLQSDVYSFSMAKGVFAGLSLEGGGVEMDTDTNRNYYGRFLTARDIVLLHKVSAPPPSARLLARALARFELMAK